MTINQQELNELTTKADMLYTSLEDEHYYADTQDFMDDAKVFLNELVNFLENMGGRVKGITYKEDQNQ